MPSAAEFSALYRRHAPTAFRRARQILGNNADAHEVVQDLFLSLFEKPEQYAQASTFTTFLYAATTNACLNRLRNHKNRFRLRTEQAEVREGKGDALSPEELLVLRRALLEMPDDLARAAVYACVDGLSHQEIADLLACSRRHVGDLLTRVNEWGKSQEMSEC